MKIHYLPGMILPDEHDWQTKAMECARGEFAMTPVQVAGLAFAYAQLLDALPPNDTSDEYYDRSDMGHER